MSVSPLVLAALAEAEKSNATVSAILTFKVIDRSAVRTEITSLVQAVAAQVHEEVEQLDVFDHIGAIRVCAHPPLIRALIARPELDRANSGLTQAPFAFGAPAKRAAGAGAI